MAEQAEECKCEPGAPKWVVTFGDMMSLLLTFFVLLLSFAEMDVVKYRRMVGSIKEAFGVSKIENIDAVTGAKNIVATKVEYPPNFTAMVALRANAAKKSKERKRIQLEQSADWVRIKVPGDALFAQGSADILPSARPILDDIAELINDYKGEVTIEGHTDNATPSGGTYLDNYALGFARANAVLAYMVTENQVDRKKLRPASLGDTHPRETNTLPEGRARNRRVEFVFMGDMDRAIPGQRVQP